MRPSIKSELRMDRVMLWHFGSITECYFCHEPLLKLAPGYGIASKKSPPPIKVKLTVHHDDGDHTNNKPSNRKPCHQKCHKQFHMKERHNASRNVRRG